MKTIYLAAVLAAAAWAQPAPAPDFPIDAATRSRVATTAASNVEKYYFNETLARQMAVAIRAKIAAGAYDRLGTAAQLANALTSDMRDVSRDGHLAVLWFATPQPVFDPDAPPPPPPPALVEQAKVVATKANGFITDAVWLPGNVGYLSLDAFADPDSMKVQLGHAMNLLANTDALIVDMRTNKGGSPAAVAVLASYFFDEQPVHLNDIVSPRQNQRTEFWTLRELDGARYGVTRPIYILTSKQTFSAPEELAYDLKVLGRATIVGEQTGGGANPTSGVPIDERFGMAIPRAEARNPHTGANWEGVGVRPDVSVAAVAAKDSAYLLALLQLRDKPGTPPFIRGQIEAAITRLLGQLGPERAAVLGAANLE